MLKVDNLQTNKQARLDCAFLRSIYLGVLLVCSLEFLSIQKEAEEAENEQVVRKKKSHLIEDLKVGKKVLDNFEDLKVGKIVLDNFEGKLVIDT